MKITNFPKPNYKAWDQINIFDHFQVTCLWADFEPSIKASRQEICYVIHKLFEEAREEGFLRSDVVKEYINGKLEFNVIFHRKDLIAYAEWKDVKPAFLYPETRTDADASIRTDSSSPPNPAALPSKAKVENQPDTAVELLKMEDAQKVQGQSSENEQPVISENEYSKEAYDLLDPLSKAKAEDLPDTAVELSKIEDVQKVQSQSNENEQPVISEHEYQKEFCDLFDPLPKKAILLIFPMLGRDLNRAIDRASRNGLGGARIGRGKFNPAKIAIWLIQKGYITQQQADILLKKALPVRSKANPIADDYFN